MNTAPKFLRFSAGPRRKSTAEVLRCCGAEENWIRAVPVDYGDARKEYPISVRRPARAFRRPPYPMFICPVGIRNVNIVIAEIRVEASPKNKPVCARNRRACGTDQHQHAG